MLGMEVRASPQFRSLRSASALSSRSMPKQPGQTGDTPSATVTSPITNTLASRARSQQRGIPISPASRPLKDDRSSPPGFEENSQHVGTQLSECDGGCHHFHS